MPLRPAAALEPPAAAPDSGEYTRTIEEAVARFRERDFERARELFAAAHALNPSARTLRSLGLTDFESGRYALAIEELEAAMVDPRKPLDPQQRSEVQAVIAHARGFVGTLKITRSPPEAALTLDDQSVTSDTLQLDVGSYVLRAEAPGYAAAERIVEIAAGDLTAVALTLQPLVTDPLPQAPVPVEYDGTQRTAAWIVGSVGLAGVIVGSVFGVRSLIKHDESDTYCGADGLCRDIRGVTAMDEARAAGDVSTVGFVVGGIALGAATVLLITSPDPDLEEFTAETAHATQLRLGLGSIHVNGVF